MDESNLFGEQCVVNNNKKVIVYYWTNLALLEQGLGLDQQRQDFTDWSNHNPAEVVAEFTDTFLKRTKPKHFPELAKAVESCLQKGASLVVAKLNGLIGQKEFADLLATKGLNFVCLDKNLVTPEVLAVVRQYVEEQSRQHGNSIKRGLKLTTNKLGNPNAAKSITPFNRIKTENAIMFALLLSPIIEKFNQQGLSQRKIVNALNDAGILAPEGGKWVLSQLQKVLKRIDANNLSLNFENQVTQNKYSDYSAAELVSSLNQGGFKPDHQELWDEESISRVKNRSKTINNVIALYGFMQAYGEEVNHFINEGKTLVQIGAELTNKGLTVPNVLLESLSTQEYFTDRQWNAQLVEELIKRMNNAIALPYNAEVMHNFSDIINEYIASSVNPQVKEVYQSPVLLNMLQSSNQTRPTI